MHSEYVSSSFLFLLQYFFFLLIIVFNKHDMTERVIESHAELDDELNEETKGKNSRSRCSLLFSLLSSSRTRRGDERSEGRS